MPKGVGDVLLLADATEVDSCGGLIAHSPVSDPRPLQL